MSGLRGRGARVLVKSVPEIASGRGLCMLVVLFLTYKSGHTLSTRSYLIDTLIPPQLSESAVYYGQPRTHKLYSWRNTYISKANDRGAK
jgi:hypothetical protein